MHPKVLRCVRAQCVIHHHGSEVPPHHLRRGRLVSERRAVVGALHLSVICMVHGYNLTRTVTSSPGRLRPSPAVPRACVLPCTTKHTHAQAKDSDVRMAAREARAAQQTATGAAVANRRHDRASARIRTVEHRAHRQLSVQRNTTRPCHRKFVTAT